ncbi:ribonuclease H-like domain-containing protein, partial [Tanacetum coccineum]
MELHDVSYGIKYIVADDLEEMDLKWQMAMLTMRARRFLNKSRRKISANGSETIRAPRENRNREPIRRNVTVETTETKALVAQDGLGYDWSDQAEKGHTNFALMAYTSSGSSSSLSSDSEVSTCSKACLKSYETLKEHYDNLIKDFNNALTELRKKFEKAEKERDDLKLKLEKFENSSKNLSKLLEIQVSDKFKTGVGFDSQVFDSQENDKYKTSKGYHAVPPPYTKNFMPPKSDLVLADEDEYVFSESVTSIPDVAISEAKTSVSKPKYVSEPLIEDWISDSDDENETEFKTKQRKPSFAKVEFVKSKEHVKTPRESVKERPKQKVYTIPPDTMVHQKLKRVSQQDLKDKGVIDSGCSRHMTGNRSYLTDYEEIDGGFVAFGGNSKGGKITGKGKIRTGKLDFEDVYFVKELKFNLFSVSQMCDKKNSVLFTDTECVVLSPDFKLTDESHVLLKVPRKDNMYSVDLKNVVPQGGLTCLFAKATPDESNLWHRRLGHVNFKTMNKLVKGNLVRGIENLIDLRVKVIRRDNGTEFKNRVMNQFCELKGIKRVFSVVRTPQKNGVAERKNRTLIEAARTMLADLKLPTTFWAEAVNIACYVQNRVLVIKPHNKTPYELFLGRKHALSFMRPFGCPVTILNTIDHLGKFDGKADEGFFVGYSTNSKAFRVFNNRTRIVEENLHVKFSEDTPNIVGSGPNWLFDIDALTNSMNYKTVVAGNQSNGNACTKSCDDAGKTRMETVPGKDYILLPLWTQDPPFSSSLKDSPDVGFKPSGEEENKDDEDPENEDSEVTSTKELRVNQEKDANVNSTNNIKTVSPTVNAAGIVDNVVAENIVYGCADDLNMPNLEEIVYSDDDDDDDDVDAEADMNNLDAIIPVSPIPSTRVHKDYLVKQIIRDLNSAPQTRRMTKLEEHGLFSSVQQR